MEQREAEAIGQAIMEAFVSPNVADGNLEAANLVDTTNYTANGLAGISVALGTLAGPSVPRSSGLGVLDDMANTQLEAAEKIAAGLHDIADAIREGRQQAS